MNRINVIRHSILALCFYFLLNDTIALTIYNTDAPDTLYVLYENDNLNKIVESRIIAKKPYTKAYPTDLDRRFEVITHNIHIWFNYSINYPSGADLIFDYKVVDTDYIKIHDFKGQEWFRNTPKEVIHDLFLGKNKIVYLIEKARIKDGKAIMIRVYPDVQTVE